MLTETKDIIPNTYDISLLLQAIRTIARRPCSVYGFLPLSFVLIHSLAATFGDISTVKNAAPDILYEQDPIQN